MKTYEVELTFVDSCRVDSVTGLHPMKVEIKP